MSQEILMQKSEANQVLRQKIRSGALAEVSVEKAIYGIIAPQTVVNSKTAPPRLFMAVKIQNLSDRPIIFDRQIFPNQIISSRKPGREGNINEERMAFLKLDLNHQRGLIQDFHNHISRGIPVIPAHGFQTYFREFNGTVENDLNCQGGFLIWVIDGQIWLTDGNATEALTLSAPEVTDSMREVAVPCPIQLKSIPNNARIIPSQPE